MEKILLNKSKLEVSRVGIGILPMGKSQKNLPLKEGSGVIEYAYNMGINLIDTAEYYETYSYISEAFKKINKYDTIISSKSLKTDYLEMTNAIDDALFKLNRDYIDIFYMHELRSNQLEKREGALKALIKAKELGKIRAIGVSTHHIDCVREVSKIIEIDVVLTLINKDGLGIRDGLSKEEISKLSESEIRSRMIFHNALDKEGKLSDMEDVIKYAKSMGKDIIGMKAFGGGNLVENYIPSLDYINNLDSLSSFLVGFTSKKEVDDIVKYFNHELPNDYKIDCSKKMMHINKEDCEGCKTCAIMCASNAISYDSNGLAQIDNNKCITCGYCAKACPVKAIIMY